MTFPTSQSNSSTITRVASAAADTLISSSSPDSKGRYIFNESTAILYLCLSKQTSTVTNYSLQLASNTGIKLNHEDYCGEIRGIWAAANGAAMVTEFK